MPRIDDDAEVQRTKPDSLWSPGTFVAENDDGTTTKHEEAQLLGSVAVYRWRGIWAVGLVKSGLRVVRVNQEETAKAIALVLRARCYGAIQAGTKEAVQAKLPGGAKGWVRDWCQECERQDACLDTAPFERGKGGK